jgi:hypothetical protein
VTLSRPVTRAVTVHYATANGTARSGSDYRAKTGTVTIPANTTGGTVNVTVVSDKVREYQEQMTVGLSSPDNATLADGTATGTVVNDDTRVGLVLTKAIQHRVRAGVSTSPIASGAPVSIYRVTKSGPVRVLLSHLGSHGRISRALTKHYSPGATVRFYAAVRTANGLYKSSIKSVTVRR